MKKVILLVVGLWVGGTALSSVATAQPWLTEQWRCDIEVVPHSIGPVWHENGRVNVALGLENVLVVVRDGEVAFERDSLNGDLTALVRIDFGQEVGPELIAFAFANQYPTWPELHRHQFSGEEFGQYHRELISMFGWIGVENYFSVSWIGETPISEQNDGTVRFPIGVVEHLHENSGLFGGDRVSGGIFGFDEWFIRCGAPRWVGKTDMNDDDVEEFIVLSDSSYYSWGDVGPPFSIGSSAVRVTAISQHGETLIVRELASAYQEDGEFDITYACRTLGGCMYDGDDGRTLLIAYLDTTGSWLQECWLNDLSTLRRAEWTLDGPADMFVVEEAGYDYLVAFTNDGKVYQFNLIDFEEAEASQMRDSSIVDTKLGNFDNDNENEILQLTGSQLVLYNLRSLSVPPPLSLIPQPLSLQSFPNPFNSSTTISYSLPKPGRYALDVVDIQGRLVTRLGEGWKESGSYKAIWNPASAASGSYRLVLRNELELRAQPVTLVR